MDCAFNCDFEFLSFIANVLTLLVTAGLGWSAIHQFKVSRRSRRHDLVAQHLQEFANSPGMKDVFYRIDHDEPIFTSEVRLAGCQEERNLDDLLNHFDSLATGARVEGINEKDLGSALYYLRAIASSPAVQEYLSVIDLYAENRQMSEMFADLRSYRIITRQEAVIKQQPVSSGTAIASAEPISSAEGWSRLTTLGRGHPFCYRLALSNLYIKLGEDYQAAASKRADVYSVAFLRDLHAELRSRFGSSPFPLSNSKDKVPTGRAADGLGSVFYQLSKRSPVLTSTLAAVLVNHKVFVQVDGRSALHFRLGSLEAFEAFLAKMG